MSEVRWVEFCVRCFASSESGSCGGSVVGDFCTNCCTSGTVRLPEYMVKSIRDQASWVGKRFYPHEEDIENREERKRLLALVTVFHGRSAVKNVDGTWRVTQLLPGGRRVETFVSALNAEHALRQASSLPYFSKAALEG